MLLTVDVQEVRMKRASRSKVLWTMWMTGGGIAAAVIVYGFTGSIGWAIVGLLASGVVLNAIAQLITQPIKAAAGMRQRLGRR
jgi:hypothetical protein